MATPPTAPGRDWLEIVTRPTLATFAGAFSADPELRASVLCASILGVAHIRTFFEATRAMYDRIGFTRETRLGDCSVVEWEGSYRAAPIQGVTILERNADGAIARVQLYYSPYEQLISFADNLATRLFDAPTPTGP